LSLLEAWKKLNLRRVLRKKGGFDEDSVEKEGRAWFKYSGKLAVNQQPLHPAVLVWRWLYK